VAGEVTGAAELPPVPALLPAPPPLLLDEQPATSNVATNARVATMTFMRMSS